MATPKQLAFVEDVEAAVAAIKSQKRTVKTIGEVLEAAGRYTTELNSNASRLVYHNGYPEIIRLQKAFAAVGIKSRCVDALLTPAIMACTKAAREQEQQEEESFHLEPSMPDSDVSEVSEVSEVPQMPEMPEVIFVTPEPHIPLPKIHWSTSIPSKALTDVIAIIAPLSTIYKQRVLQSAGLFYGVGE